MLFHSARKMVSNKLALKVETVDIEQVQSSNFLELKAVYFNVFHTQYTMSCSFIHKLCFRNPSEAIAFLRIYALVSK